MEPIYAPPDQESKHLKNEWDLPEPGSWDRVWVGFVIGLVAHVIQPIMWWLSSNWRFDWEPAMTAFTQILYLLPLSFLVNKTIGLRAFKGIYLLLIFTAIANLGLFAFAIAAEQFGYRIL